MKARILAIIIAAGLILVACKPAPLPYWEELAQAVERVFPFADVVSMGRRDESVVISFAVRDDPEGDGAVLLARTMVGTLLRYVDDPEAVEYLVLSVLLDPQSGDERYPMIAGIVCKVEGGEVVGCETSPLSGGYLSPDSVEWPGRYDEQ